MIGARLGNWVVDRELGRGGMGEVYLAHEQPQGPGGERRAAVKVLAPELAREAGFQVRFQREIDVLRQLDHPNVVRFFESGAQDGQFFYVMEYVEGRNLEELLRDRGRLPWAEVLDVAAQVSLALKHAHDRGVIHRDLKPSNLLQTAEGVVKLTDFGIAKVFAGEHLTATGGVVGTAEYLSPEQATGKPVTKRSDLYSLGVVLYTLLVGRTPFVSESLVDLLHKHRFAQFEMPRTLVPEIPHDLEAIVCQLLEKDPAQRPGDAAVLHRQLESVRRKLERQSAVTAEAAADGARHRTRAGRKGRGPGPATVMSRLMREELESQKRGGPVKRLLSKPWVLVPLLLLCVGLIVWGMWPASAETLFRRGETLMQSEDTDNWDAGWEALEKLDANYPDHPYKEQVEKYRRQYGDLQTQRQAARAARWAGPTIGEGEWFYKEGVRLRQKGDPAGAEHVWRALVQAYRDVPAEKPWVDLAQKELARKDDAGRGDDRWAGVQRALERARRLRDEGKPAEAEEVWHGLEELYRGDPSARDVLEQVRRERGQPPP